MVQARQHLVCVGRLRLLEGLGVRLAAVISLLQVVVLLVVHTVLAVQAGPLQAAMQAAAEASDQVQAAQAVRLNQFAVAEVVQDSPVLLVRLLGITEQAEGLLG